MEVVMKRAGILTATLLLSLLLSALLATPLLAAPAYWSEGWEYGAVHQVGTGSDGWQNNGTVVSTTAAHAHNGDYSVAIDSQSWIVHDFSPALESGRWLLSAWVYVPSGGQTPDTDASTWLIWNADASTAAGLTVFSTWIGTAKYKTGQSAGATLLRDTWAEFRAELDLDADHALVTYNGSTLFDGAYTADYPGGSPRLFNLQLLGLTGSAGTIYVDDLSLSHLPETAAALKHEACAGLETILTGLNDPAASRLVSKALASVRLSLTPAWWLDDSRLRESDGGRVFSSERKAVADLRSAVLRFGLDPAPAGRVIDALVMADYVLATTALADAQAAGGRTCLIRLAERSLLTGDRYRAQAEPLRALDCYCAAWKSAVSAY
jgi:hypothetical protein